MILQTKNKKIKSIDFLLIRCILNQTPIFIFTMTEINNIYSF